MRPIIICFLALSYQFLFAQNFTNKSILSEGQIVKLTILETGVYKISSDQISAAGINISNLNPKTIKIYGNGGGMLPELINIDRVDDLSENPIIVTGEADGSMDPNDEIIFYAEGATNWQLDSELNDYRSTPNIYDNENYYFLVVTPGDGKRIASTTNSANSDYSTAVYKKDIRHESELINLLGSFGSTEGTGQSWYGETFTNTPTQNFDAFNFPDIQSDMPIRLEASFAGRNNIATSVDIMAGGHKISKIISQTNTGNVESIYAKLANFNQDIPATSENMDVSVTFNKTSGTAEGWLDFIQISAYVSNRYTGEAYHFYDPNSINAENTSYQINSSIPATVWNVTDPTDVKNVNASHSGSTLSFTDKSNEQLQRYFVFDQNTDVKQVTELNTIANQNLHSLDDANFVILYHDDFVEAAEKLYAHRMNIRPIETALVDIDEVYNEFSSGRCDPTAIRDFARMLHKRNPNFNYLLLLGDGSYDYRNIVPNQEDQNFIPVYETKSSLDPITGFPSDDYYGLLSDNDGLPTLKGALELALGRLPAKTAEHALDMVDKIVHYETSTATLGDWRNRVAFAADDEDTNTHINQSDEIATKFGGNNPVFNQEKIYFDAFQQESTPGGERFPDATKKINDGIFKGELVLNYLGHGGPKGWAQERVLKISDINSWDNADRLPLIVTATCSFTGYDDPAVESAGEVAIGRKEGGAVALFTTTRAVYASSNKRLAEAVFDTLMNRDENGNFLRLGQVLKQAKNANFQDTSTINSRKFTLMGDPTMTLASPLHTIALDSINGVDLEQILEDTLSALDQIVIKGHIEDYFGNKLTDFNGDVYVTLFDKEKTIRTLVNDPKSREKDFQVRENILFKGNATVENGVFSLSFFIPQDINFSYGTGKISMYARQNDSLEDANGYFDQINIGGSTTPDFVDDLGPTVELFMNDESFRSGGICNPDPILIVKLEDDYGINISGTSIGHDLTAILDGNSSNTFILNDFYESEANNSSKGIVRFPLADIEPGLHTITVKAWDISNNSSEATIEFLVLDQALGKIMNTYAYPNPFNNTVTFGFEHDLPLDDIILEVEIHDITGKLVKTLTNDTFGGGYQSYELNWDGLTQFGSNLANGTYLFQINLRSRDGKTNIYSDFNKLIKID